jgi:putative component of toxin-antitoxin plasmid stabilization module
VLYFKGSSLRLEYYPEDAEPNCEGYVKEFLRKDLKKRRDLRSRVESFFAKLETMKDLGPLFRSGQLASLGDGLYEMRIPPVAHGGVVRIYYCECPNDSLRMMLLDAELKHEKAASRHDAARKRMVRYLQQKVGDDEKE